MPAGPALNRARPGARQRGRPWRNRPRRRAQGRDLVVGVEGSDGATRAVAFVVASEGAAADELRQWCAAGLARFKVPDVVHLVPGLPMTDGPNGVKVRTATLREWARERHADL